MFRNDVLKTNVSCSEKEGVLLYTGWEILAYSGGNSQEELKVRLREHFSGDGWTYCEDNHRMFAHYQSIDYDVEIVSQKMAYSGETYELSFKSPYIGFREKGEKRHQKLFQMAFSRIPWKKRGFWLKEGKRFPIPRNMKLRMKR